MIFFILYMMLLVKTSAVSATSNKSFCSYRGYEIYSLAEEISRGTPCSSLLKIVSEKVVRVFNGSGVLLENQNKVQIFLTAQHVTRKKELTPNFAEESFSKLERVQWIDRLNRVIYDPLKINVSNQHVMFHDPTHIEQEVPTYSIFRPALTNLLKDEDISYVDEDFEVLTSSSDLNKIQLEFEKRTLLTTKLSKIRLKK